MAHALTQAEVAAAVGASDESAVSQWETGIAVPDGLRRERLTELLEGRLWSRLRAALVAGEGMPDRWTEAVRRYRRASRERGQRAGVGAVVAALLASLRDTGSPGGLRERYREGPAGWASGLSAGLVPAGLSAAELRQAEEAAYGLRWLELARGGVLDPQRLLVHQLPPALLNQSQGETRSR